MDASNLHCIICPGRPRFSDVSHLLTHISSKAHLANNFKLQVRGHQDKDAVRLLKEYNDWYSFNDLQSLLSDRINTKNDRKRKRKSQSKTVDESNEEPPTKRPHSGKTADVTPATPLMNIPEYLDPRLMQPQPTAGSEQESTAALPPEYFQTPSFHRINGTAKIVRLATKSGFTSFVSAEDLTDGAADDGQEYSITLPVTPKPTRTRAGLRFSKPIRSKEETTDPFFVSNKQSEKSNEGDSEDKERSDEIARLKGVFWPGMDIFDSATHQMRRKRNQKKDSTVLKLMEITSALVEPTEQIFSLEGELLKERVISGNVDEDSPLKGETPIPKERQTRTKKKNVLRPKDANRLIKKGSKKGARSLSYNHGQYDGAGSPRRSPRLNGMQRSYAEENPDYDLTVRAFAKRSRDDFSILADCEQHEKESFRDQQHARIHPAQDTLTPARLILDHRTDISKNAGRRYDDQTVPGKENIEPLLHQHGELEFSGWNSPLAKRSGMNQHNYQSDFFFAEHEEDDDVKCGHRCNPLFAPSSRMGISLLEDPSYEDFTVAGAGWNIPRAQSSEATVSERDQQELTGLYLAGGTD